ncbi:MAG TPA: sugar phosphate isomerase/epimerase family protein [Rhodothermales bacterium]|nr:sugar phosphate isomerase/epimerase family protein [Rhodothermales bacterium]
MKIGLYTVSYAGLWYDGPALSFDEIVRRAREYGYDGIELDAKRPHGSPLDLDARARARIRELVERAGLEIPCVAANNDFSSPLAEHREAQLLMVRETARLAADLGAKVVRLFAAWPGIALRDGRASYDLVRGQFYTFERQYPYATWLERWNLAKNCLREAAAFGEEFGVVMALQNHAPLIRHWKDMYDLVREVDSPWLKACLDLPIMTRFDRGWVADAVRTVGPLQVHTHFGGEFYRDEDGRAQLRWHNWGQPAPDYPHFIRLLREIGYDGYLGYELCHPVLNEYHEYAGLDYVDEQVRLAREYMGRVLEGELPAVEQGRAVPDYFA